MLKVILREHLQLGGASVSAGIDARQLFVRMLAVRAVLAIDRVRRTASRIQIIGFIYVV